MTVDAWIAVAAVLGVFAMIAWTSIPLYLTMLASVAALLILHVITPQEALSGFSNEGMVTVAVLFIVAAGLTETGAVSASIQRLLGRPSGPRLAQARLTVPVAVASAFLNNTPVVAMLMPVVHDWSRRIRIPASLLLIPLSYAAILGGVITLIGTSTNLVVHGLLIEAGRGRLGMFDITPVGLACTVVGIAFMVLVGPWLLPRREDSMQVLDDPREYTLEMTVDPGSALVGQTIEGAGLRHLPGLFLAEIHRRGRLRPAVEPYERLDANDHLVFVGLVDSIIELQKTKGLRPATTQLFKLDAPRSERWFVEAVVSHSCPLVGQSIREGNFRNKYNAVVIAVARNGQRIKKRTGDIILHAGDALLLEALPAFVEQHRNSNDFYLVSRFENASPPNHDKALPATVIMLAMVGLAVTGVLSILQAAAGAAAAMLLLGCVSEETARRKVDWQVLLAIAASFGLGHALQTTGAAQTIAGGVIGAAGSNPYVALIAVYAITTVLSSTITHNAAAVLVFPIALAAADSLGVSHMPFVIALMVAASASFATPLGYQTNLMVYGAGGYHFSDFVRVGLPLSVVVGAVTIVVTPMVFPF